MNEHLRFKIINFCRAWPGNSPAKAVLACRGVASDPGSVPRFDRHHTQSRSGPSALDSGFGGFLFLCCVVLASIGQVSANPAMGWVEKMSDSMSNLSYRGNFVYLHENKIESMSILHIKDDSGEKERLLSLNGEAREVIRDNKNLTCIWPDSRKVVVENSHHNSYSPLFSLGDISKIGKYYDMSMTDDDRVADQEAVVVDIKPKDGLRYGFRLWLNSGNGLLLKSILLSEQNDVLEQVVFTDLEVLDKNNHPYSIPMPELDSSFTLVRYHSGDGSENLEVDMNWRVASLPDGFWQKSALKRRVAETEHFIQQMVYTDGLASMSVFIEKQSGQTQQGETSMGAVNGYIRLLDDYSVTAIGEVPAITVRLVAESVSYQVP